jgi:anti-sigma regulatory factor (Ser/Thr protein kinase)
LGERLPYKQEVAGSSPAPPIIEATPTLELTLPPELGSIGRARDAVRAFGAEVGADPVAVAQAVSEAVTSIVLYAARPELSSSGSIAIRGERVGGQLVVSVAHVAPGSTAKGEPARLGLGISTIGLALIGGFTESVEIEPSDRGAGRLLMRFKLARRK